MTGWDVRLRLEPSEFEREQIGSFLEMIRLTTPSDVGISVNPMPLGVLVNPWKAFESAIELGSDFIVRAEDDLLASTDILRYFEWASERWQDDKSVATVNAYSKTQGEDPFHVSVRQGAFNPLVWGTWKDRWLDYIGPTWDKDYSTFNDYPGNQAGWDWNLNTRVLPALGKSTVNIDQSRVQNIGVWGVHATPENFEQAPGWEHDYGAGRFWTDD
jgi:hypothetical protein